MEEYANYFKYKNGKKYTLKFDNLLKIVTFVNFIPDLNFCSGWDNREFELLKMEILTKKPLNILSKLLERYTYKPHFWAFKKGKTQYLGISFNKFKDFLERRGYVFIYPIITDIFFLIFSGKTGAPDSYKLFVYFNNSRMPYVDSIKIFKEEQIGSDFPIKLERIKTIKREEKLIYKLPEEVPKLIAKGGQLYQKEMYNFFFFIKRFQRRSNSIIDKLSHIMVFSRDRPIEFNEKRKFFISLLKRIELDEVILLSANIYLHKEDKMFL